MENNSLAKRAFSGLLKFQIALAAMLFLPAWSLTWWQGWVCWALYGLCSALTSLYFLRHAPRLVERRLGVGPRAEREPAQQRIQLAASVFVAAIFIVSAFDYHFGWSRVPLWLVLSGEAAIVLSFVAIFFVFRENEFAAATVGVMEGQRVVSSGPYALVRHPMYSAAALLFVGSPLSLGSWWGLIPVAFLIATLVARLADEERHLARGLAGYTDYQSLVRWRLVPGLF